MKYLLFFCCIWVTELMAFDYQLKAERINPSTYVVLGAQEDFTPANGGALANIAFVVTAESVVLIDAGPSKKYGEQLRALIRSITHKPLSHLILTHAHPDHFLASAAFADIAIIASDATRAQIEQEGPDYNANMFRLVLDAMKGTQVHVPPKAALPETLRIGGHVFKLMRMAGHSKADLVVLDENTGTLFTGDLVFHGRTPTTPHADLRAWQNSLQDLRTLPFRQLVPGHGPVATDLKPIGFTADYLTWLDHTLSQAARQGKDPAEILHTNPPMPMAVFRAEFARSVAHLYPRYEQAILK
ncbi:MAG: hypothetical protein RLZZ502_1437 [Pseudomonadota bacterium]|jgi:uncharacterized sulfatase